MSKTSTDIVVIGAGVVGISCALSLQASGRQVLVLDRKGIAAEASQGNAGAFAFTDIIPLATPGVMARAPRWLLDPLGPLSVPPGYAMQIAPWMLRFWRASWKDRYQTSLTAQAGLMRLSQAALDAQIVDTDAGHMIRPEGQLQLFEGEADFRASRPAWETHKAHGIPYRLLESPEEIAEIQPGIAPQFTHAGFTPTWRNLQDPALWVQYLADVFVARGGQVRTANVSGLNAGDGVTLDLDGEVLRAKQIVICAGAWSHHLARMLGDRIPLETERGYNTTLPAGAFDLRTHLTFGGHGFVVSRINDGVRVGGAVELGGLKRAPNYARAQVLLDKAKRFLPGLNDKGGTQWMGFRPSMPDSLPVIGAANQNRSVIYAFGHGHLGLTQSAGTAQLVAEIASGAPPSLDLGAFAPDRF